MRTALLTLGLLFLAACSPQTPATTDPLPATDSDSTTSQESSDPISWISYHDVPFGITLMRPAQYQVQETLSETINTSIGTTFNADFIYMHEPDGGEAPFIEILRTKDPVVLTAYLNADHPLEKTVINGQEWQKFQWEGMGDPFGYVSKHGEWYVIVSFTGWDEPYAIDRVMETVQFDS